MEKIIFLVLVLVATYNLIRVFLEDAFEKRAKRRKLLEKQAELLTKTLLTKEELALKAREAKEQMNDVLRHLL